jgi:hypothetical protein
MPKISFAQNLIPEIDENNNTDYAPSQITVTTSDQDADGIISSLDNCPTVYNPGQEDTDGSSESDFIVYFKMDEGSGVESNDLINSIPASHNASWVEGISSYALDFDGIDDNFQVSNTDVLNPDGSITIELWLKINSFSKKWQTIVFKGKEPDDYYEYKGKNRQYGIWVRDDGLIYFGSTSSDGNYYYCSSPVGVIDTSWHQIAGVIDIENGLMRIYIDSALISECTYSKQEIKEIEGYLRLGWFDFVQVPDTYLDGVMDEFAIFGKVLSQAEIGQHHQNGLNGAGYLNDGVGDACDACPDSPLCW